MSKLSRRGFVGGLLAGAIVLGFDPAARSWVTEAKANGCNHPLPQLDGELTTDPSVLAEMADDFGHIIHRTPVAVLRPGSVDDIVKMVKYARQHDLQIAGRGKGHTAFGQSQADAGLVIDMTTLDEIHSITSQQAVVDAGVVWRDLLLETTACGFTPPVLTDFIGLTIGGTLSVGGVNGTSFRHGAQVDNVLELKVVTGEGDLVTCSPTKHKDLFNAVLAGLGLCAIIVRATLKLIPAEDLARTCRMFYPDVATMLGDLRTLISDGRFTHVRGMGAPGPTSWGFFIEATTFYSAPHAPNDAALQAGLHFIPGATQFEEKAYFDFCDIVFQQVEFLKTVGWYALPHPWVDLFVPGPAMNAFATATVASLDPATTVPGSLILIYPLLTNRFKTPMLRVPDTNVAFLFDLLLAAPPDPNVVNAMVQQNRARYDSVRGLGGTLYTISAVPMNHQDWKKHFQPNWSKLVDAKQQNDPDNVLGAGLGVFG